MANSAWDGSRQLRLLVVEDEAMIAMMLTDMLEDLGHEVVGVAATVGRALHLLEEHRLSLDGVLLDANLGGEPVAQVVTALRDADIPFVLASGYEEHELRRLGFDEAPLRKPYRKSEVSRAIMAQFGQGGGCSAS